MTSPLSLLIFDCDGVLVDSEEIGIGVLLDVAKEHGPLAMELSEAMQLFRGRKMAECADILAERLGRPLPENFIPEVRVRTAEAFRRDLKAIPGIHEALREITIPVCVASNGPREKIELSLSVTGLLPRFEGRIFSSYEVGSWKPDPGLYLHAAAAMGVAPADCAVVEDSVLGTRAGVAAGMRVFAYTPEGSTAKIDLPGVTCFAQMPALPELLHST
ncbi:MAG: HAD family hydrolase [Chthoniobacter sp.]|uniref:HAD family hydrolase n=1 Tax=Chthoniobacter sp. TaxID=2510640 RepID=UPI0032A93364